METGIAKKQRNGCGVKVSTAFAHGRANIRCTQRQERMQSNRPSIMDAEEPDAEKDTCPVLRGAGRQLVKLGAPRLLDPVPGGCDLY